MALATPEVLEFLADGRLSVTTACVLAPHLTPETADELLAASSFRSRQEIVRLLAERSQLAEAGTLTLDGPNHVEDSSSLSAPVRIDSPADDCVPPANEGAPGPVAPAQSRLARRGRIFSSDSGGHEVRLTLTDEEHADLRQAQAHLGHAVPSGDPALVYARAMKLLLAHLEKQRLGARPGASVPASVGRGIPKPLRRLVWERDGGRCAFVSTDGHRCEETRRLELDHIQPIAAGGATTPENLRLLCRPHNQFEAERLLGSEHVRTRRELAQRERARARAEKAASATRARARAAAKHEHHDDILTALRGLGFKPAEAKRGAELAGAMPDASLEACLRRALTELTRAVVVRGERRARCTA